MEKIFIKKLNKEIEIDSWNESNKICLEVLSKYIIESKLGISIIETTISDDGFSIDFEIEKNVSENSLQLIEGKVRKQLEKNIEVKSELPSSMVKNIKLMGVSGITLDDKKGNRIFGFATLNKNDFETKLIEIKDRQERDHRKVAKDLDLFMIDDLSGKGMPIWLENGVLLKRQIQDYIWKQEKKYGSKQIETPVLGSLDLYKISGHYDHYKENMFPKMKIEENETFMLRPMACPHHVLVYKRKPRSYKELPIRISENVKQYRYEYSGALIGLERVRAMELTDSHIFLREDQLKDEIIKGYALIKETLKKFNIEIYYIELALHDPKDNEKYHGDKELWLKSEKMLKEFLDESNIEYKEMKGEAAFYGPKIDIQIKTALGHINTVSTIQLDFLLPERFGLVYKNSEQELIKPIMIHRGLIGTYERFISILLEQTKGNLPMWLAPRQSVIIPINNEAHSKYAKDIYNELLDLNIRVELDDSDERLSNKIRIHQKSKVKTQIIIGDNEVKNNNVTYRFYGEEESHTVLLKELLNLYKVK